uniref:Uncharacterized protein n=2 Tax=Parascaris univalens TaxID=6257 RepID=A0A915BTV5_PARUN
MWLLMVFFPSVVQLPSIYSLSLPFPLPLKGVFKCPKERVSRFANTITVHCENVSMSAKSVEGSRGMVISVNAPRRSACEKVLKEVAVKCFQGYLLDEPIRFIAATDHHIEGKIEECDGRLAMWECDVDYMYGTFVFNVICGDAVTISMPIYSGYNASTLLFFIILVALCSFAILFSYILTVHLREIAEQIRDATD